MHIVIFGLTISSSWGNGHATLWRSLVKAMVRRGHTVSFYERSVPYYARERDLEELPTGASLYLYECLADVEVQAAHDLDDATLAVCTSYCPDGPMACRLILDSRAEIKAFYDLDTPVTLRGLEQGGAVEYLPSSGLGDFDIVLSYTGGRALEELQTRLGAKSVAPLYGSVDPESHSLAAPQEEFRASLSYLGTYAADRQPALEKLFLRPASRLPAHRFLIGGAQYPENFPWASNIAFVRHVPPPMHPAFFASCRATLNVTRRAMADYGYCPSGRLFEAAACGAPLISDVWEGLQTFFTPGREILLAETAEQVVEALSLSDTELGAIASAARERVLSEHTGERRVHDLEVICETVRQRTAQIAAA